MAAFNTEHKMHRVHALLQNRRWSGFVFFLGLGLVVGGALVGHASFRAHAGDAGQSAAAAKQIIDMREAIAKSKTESARLNGEVTRLEMAPAVAAANALNTGGVSEDMVAYWRKQMDAFSQLTGVRLAITGRGASKFKDASKLIVSIAPMSSATAAAMPAADIAQALDFLQLYGYVESFNGSDAVVHIRKI